MIEASVPVEVKTCPSLANWSLPALEREIPVHAAAVMATIDATRAACFKKSLPPLLLEEEIGSYLIVEVPSAMQKKELLRKYMDQI